MKTAELFIDILFVGFLSFVWLSGFAFTFLIDIESIKNFFSTFPEGVILFLLFISYSLGIVFDYVNSYIFSIFKSAEEKDLYKKMSLIKLLKNHQSFDDFFETFYGRLRILRSIIISIPLITISLSFFIFFNEFESLKVSKNCAIFIIILMGISFMLLSIWSYKLRNKQYKKYISDLIEV